MKMGEIKQLFEGYKISWMEKDEFFKLKHSVNVNPFEEIHSIFPASLFSDSEKEQVNALRENLYKDQFWICLALFTDEDEFVGWSFGYQTDQMSFYMCNSAVFEQHRRKGLYNTFLKINLEILTEKGFQLIYSRHTTTNNAVIIPKLRAGFVISTLELDDVFGVLVTLKYFTNKKRKKIMDYRAGQIKPDDEILSLI